MEVVELRWYREGVTRRIAQPQPRPKQVPNDKTRCSMACKAQCTTNGFDEL